MVDNIKNRLFELSKKKTTIEPVTVEGVTAYVKYLNSGELMKLRDAGEDAFQACVILACDEKGKPVFDSAEEVSQLDRDIVKAIVEAGVKLNVPKVEELKN